MFIEIDAAGRATGVLQIASPNCDERPDGATVRLLVIHNISLPPGEFGGTGIVELFTNTLDPAAHPYYAQIAGLKVSAHFLVRRDGAIVQFVATEMRAWHAGVSNWNGRERCNDFSIGIELEGSDHQAFCDAQYESLALLTRYLLIWLGMHLLLILLHTHRWCNTPHQLHLLPFLRIRQTNQ